MIETTKIITNSTANHDTIIAETPTKSCLILLGKGGVTVLGVRELRHLQNKQGKRKLILSYFISLLHAIYIVGAIAKRQKQITESKGQITKSTNRIILTDSSVNIAYPIPELLLGLVVLYLTFHSPSKNTLSSR